MLDTGSLTFTEPAQPAAQPAAQPKQPLGAIENMPPPPPPQQHKPIFAKVKVGCLNDTCIWKVVWEFTLR